MNGPLKILAPLVAALTVAACNAGGSSSVPPAFGQSNAATRVTNVQPLRAGRRVCSDFRPGYMHCDALIVRQGIQPNVAGWTPADFQAAYNLPSSSNGKGQLVAIVDAFDNPNVTSDLAAYRSYFGLPAAKFTKYNQKGQIGNYPVGNQGWGLEEDLDVQMVSAVCPKCKIYLIESKNNGGRSLYAAEREAVKLGATIISNSWGGGAGGATHGAFGAPGVTYLASAGDGGYGMQDPADYVTVVSVGGTVLSKSGSTYSEIAWPFTGGGCSVVGKPAWQHDPTCAMRTGNDVAAVASDAAEYDSYGYGGWITVSGTSISSPLLGGVYGLAGNASSRQSGELFWRMRGKRRQKDLHDITSGSVTGCPPSLKGTYLCEAGTGQYKTYAGPTGWGTPNGIGAF